MNAVCAAGGGNIGTIVYEEPGCAFPGEGGGLRRELVEHARAQIFFTDLNQINSSGHRCLNYPEDICKVFSCRRCPARRLAAGDEVQKGTL